MAFLDAASGSIVKIEAALSSSRITQLKFVQHRQIESARGEALKAGMTFENFLKVWCARGSQGLQAGWLRQDERKSNAPSETVYQRSMREKFEAATGRSNTGPSYGANSVIDITPTFLEIKQ